MINDPVLGLVEDIQNPFMGPDQLTLDGWIAYQRTIFKDKIGWKVQLNVRNLLNDNLLVPVKSNAVAIGDRSNYSWAAVRIGAERGWTLASTFTF